MQPNILLTIASSITTFLFSVFLTNVFIKFFKEIGLLAIDIHKKEKPKVPTSGGIPVMFSFIGGTLFFLALSTFVFHNIKNVKEILGILLSTILISFVGFFDDLRNPLFKSKFEIKRIKKIARGSAGLPQWLKPLLTFVGAIPLMSLKMGVSTMTLPIIGTIDFGIFYPLLLIPIGVIGASNAINLLGGFNGVEAGMGVVYFTFLGIFAITKGIEIYPLFFIATFSLLGFLLFNWFPAKILPGDSLTYFLGGLLASLVIAGNMEKAGIIVILPFAIEFLLKVRSRFKASSLGKLRKDGSIAPPYGKKIYSLTHLVMNIGKFKEYEITIILISIEIIFASLIFFI